jgi:hypothetical protein
MLLHIHRYLLVKERANRHSSRHFAYVAWTGWHTLWKEQPMVGSLFIWLARLCLILPHYDDNTITHYQDKALPPPYPKLKRWNAE